MRVESALGEQFWAIIMGPVCKWSELVLFLCDIFATSLENDLDSEIVEDISMYLLLFCITLLHTGGGITQGAARQRKRKWNIRCDEDLQGVFCGRPIPHGLCGGEVFFLFVVVSQCKSVM